MHELLSSLCHLVWQKDMHLTMVTEVTYIQKSHGTFREWRVEGEIFGFVEKKTLA